MNYEEGQGKSHQMLFTEKKEYLFKMLKEAINF